MDGADFNPTPEERASYLRTARANYLRASMRRDADAMAQWAAWMTELRSIPQETGVLSAAA